MLLNDIPEETLNLVDEFLDLKSAASFSAVNKRLSTNSTSRNWESSFSQYFPGKEKSQQENYKQAFAREYIAVLAAVRQDFYALQYASAALRADREVALAAVQQHGRALQFVSAAFRADREIVLAAVQQHGWALHFASAALRADREIALAAVRKLVLVLYFVSAELTADREFILEAVRQNIFAFDSVPYAFRADREIALAAVRKWDEALEFASDECSPDAKLIHAIANIRKKALIGYLSRIDESFLPALDKKIVAIISEHNDALSILVWIGEVPPPENMGDIEAYEEGVNEMIRTLLRQQPSISSSSHSMFKGHKEVNTHVGSETKCDQEEKKDDDDFECKCSIQ
jgi:Domain of unknown function (DUF4116)